MTKLQAKAPIRSLAPYRQGQSNIEGVREPIKLSSNESSYGPSPLAVEAYHSVEPLLNRYPDGAQTALREAIADVYKLDANRIICGNGSDELIQLLVRTYVGDGDEAVLSENGFIMCNTHLQAAGASLHIAPEHNYCVNVDEMLSRVTEKTRFCTIANPNNPTGTYISDSEVRRLHAGLPEHCIFLIDGAYAEYVMKDDFSDGLAMVDEFENVVVSRTFSKIYGLPGLRIGWMLCSEAVTSMVQRVRTPFNTNSAALAAAVAAIQDQPYMHKVRDANADSLRSLSEELSELGIEVIPSVANFYLLRFSADTGKSGSGAAECLLRHNIIPRPAGDSDEYLRITVGTPEENTAVMEAMRTYMAG